MGTTFVQIQDNGFWVRDQILEVFLRFAALNIEEPTDNDSNKSDVYKIRDNWLLASKGYFNGAVPHGINEISLSEIRKNVVIKAITALLNNLNKSPSSLNSNVLNLMGFDGLDFSEDIESWRITELAQATLDLLNGKITQKANCTDFMPGSGSQPHPQ